MAVVLKLGEYVVPYLDIAVAFAAYGTIRLSAAILFSPVIIDLGTGAAGACAMLPEVILSSKTEDPFCGDTDLLVPDLKGLFIVQVDGRIEPVGIQSHHLGQEFPGPVEGFGLKIISKGKVSQHLKEGAVAGGLSDILDIACTDTLLAGTYPAPGWDLLAGKIGL